MNRTISINLGGSVINIEEDAFTLLKSYLDLIKRNFVNDPASNEIMNDIEMRLAEIFAERMNERKNVVVKEDVEHAISIMGQPEDFKMDDNTDSERTSYSGSADSRNSKRRIFRDKDDAIAGGVCSGLSHYFGWDPLVLRLIVVVIFFASAGTAILGYIIFWALVPIAETTTEKLQMRGEPVNVENISRFINEEARSAGERINKWGKKTAGNASRYGTDAANVLGRVLSIFFGLILLLLGLGLLMFLFSLFMITDTKFFGFGASGWNTVDALLFQEDSTMWMLLIGGILVIASPAIAFIYSGLRLMVKTGRRIKGLGVSLSILFVIGVVLCFWGSAKTASEFKRDAEVKSISEMAAIAGDTLHLEMLANTKFPGRTSHNHDFSDLVRIEDDAIYYGESIELRVEPSKSMQYKVVVIKRSNGNSLQEANTLANEVGYDFSLTKDSLLLSDHFSTPRKSKYRAQRIEIKLYVPVGNYVSFGDQLKYITWFDSEHSIQKMGEDGLIEDEEDNKEENAKVRITDDSVYIKTKEVEIKTSRNR